MIIKINNKELYVMSDEDNQITLHNGLDDLDFTFFKNWEISGFNRKTDEIYYGKCHKKDIEFYDNGNDGTFFGCFPQIDTSKRSIIIKYDYKITH